MSQEKALILSFLELENLRALQYQDRFIPICRKKTIKKSKFSGAKSGHTQKKFLIVPILFLYYELKVYAY